MNNGISDLVRTEMHYMDEVVEESNDLIDQVQTSKDKPRSKQNHMNKSNVHSFTSSDTDNYQEDEDGQVS